MIKYFCDKCDREISEHRERFQIDLRVKASTFITALLCHGCLDELKRHLGQIHEKQNPPARVKALYKYKQSS